MKLDYLHPREQLVRFMERIYKSEMTTISGGNLSILDENGDVWITPAGIDKGKLTPGDIVCVHPDGGIDGAHAPSSEYPFHRAIYDQRPDLHAVVHAHPPALVAFSATGTLPDTRIIPQANRVCGPVGYAPYALPGSDQLGQKIAESFAEGYNIILLENHGLAAGGDTLLEAFQRMETLDFCARTLINAARLGNFQVLSEAQLNLFSSRQHFLPEYILQQHSSRERELRQQIVEIVHRACDRHLMISTEGVVSARVGDNSFLITPTGADRRSLEIEDIVLIKNSQREAGKLPSRSVLLHETIYQAHPEINCIITAQSPNALAYAVTPVYFDSKTIPESYILLREAPMVEFNTLYNKPEQVAKSITQQTPVLMIRNDSVLTVGNSVLQAFDRLEVLEYTAKALLNSKLIGSLSPISEEEIHELKAKFLGE
ncbi:MAG: class II aldolase/adducin family protein [Anaerolineaceae bacterium]|nr:class II aldolase/adducin family protein [Anaerolineaceae bacterium]